MSNSAADPSPFDPLERMPPDEPRFVLRGSDPDAPSTITEWAALHRKRSIRTNLDDKMAAKSEKHFNAHKAALSKAAAAEDLAHEMTDWRNGNEEAVEGSRVTHGVEKTEEQLEALAGQKKRERALKQIQETRFHIGEMVDQLLDVGIFGETEAAPIRAWQKVLGHIHDRADPTTQYVEPQLEIGD